MRPPQKVSGANGRPCRHPLPPVAPVAECLFAELGGVPDVFGTPGVLPLLAQLWRVVIPKHEFLRRAVLSECREQAAQGDGTARH